MNWSEIIKEINEHHGIKTIEIHRRTKISKGYLSHLESGKQHDPSMTKALALLKLHPAIWIIKDGEITKQ